VKSVRSRLSSVVPERGPVLGDLRLEVRGGRCEEREDLDLLTSDLIPLTSV
jgi:hypothetical protein